MFAKLKEKFNSINVVRNYRKIFPYVRPYWWRALLSILITIPIGSMDAVIAWSLKPYMDVVMVEKSTQATNYIPVLIIVFSCLQSLLNYAATYLNTWVGRKIANDVKMDLFDRLMYCEASFFDRVTSGQVMFGYNNDVDTACNGLLSGIFFGFADFRFVLQFLAAGADCGSGFVRRALSADDGSPADKVGNGQDRVFGRGGHESL